MEYVLRRSSKGQHVPSKWEAGSQNRCKNLANTRLDLRNAANSLQIEGKWGCYLGGGATWGPIPFGGRGGTSRAEDGIMYMYMYMYMHMCMYVEVCICVYMYANVCICMSMYVYVCLCMFMYVYVCICMHMYVDVCRCVQMYVSVCICMYIPVVPHKAVAEVSKIGSLQERLVVVNQGWRSESTDGPKGA